VPWNNRSMNFWSSALGFLFGIAANHTFERWTVYRANRAAKRLAGEWTAHNLVAGDPRSIDPQTMPGAGLTVISARPWWRRDSHILDVYAQDLNDGNVRHHHGWIAIDRDRPQRATRTIFYEDKDEIEEQRILVSDDGDTLHVFDESVGESYSKRHALKRRLIAPSTIIDSMTTDAEGGPPRVSDHKQSVSAVGGRYALVCFFSACLWLVVVTLLVFLSGFSVTRTADSVLIAAIAAIPALFLISILALPRSQGKTHFSNIERDPESGKFRDCLLDTRLILPHTVPRWLSS
jgi:hypothetical protein